MKNFKRAKAQAALDWPKDLLSISDLSPQRVREALQLAQRVKEAPGAYQHSLTGCHAVLLFEKPSLRTRLTFEIGMATLGGTASFVDCQHQRIGERESVKDMAKNLERWCSVLVLRTFSHAILEELARNTVIPVINALSDFEHPAQVLADMLTLQQRWEEVQGRKVVYVGDPNNVSNSLMQVCAMLGVHFVLISPAGYAADPVCCERAWRAAEQSGSSVELSHDLGRLFGADAVYTDVWTSMGQESQAEKKRRDFAGYQVTPALMNRAGKKALFLHCLPAHRGEEVVDAVIDGPRSAVYDQAENRLHVHKALLLKALRNA
ncbi:MAG: ornithine carbamoyltransferase [Acidobacteria bacterium]|nr:ornithine carbamoyltransferase [Acidobacteriota bacterium]